MANCSAPSFFGTLILKCDSSQLFPFKKQLTSLDISAKIYSGLECCIFEFDLVDTSSLANFLSPVNKFL